MCINIFASTAYIVHVANMYFHACVCIPSTYNYIAIYVYYPTILSPLKVNLVCSYLNVVFLK